MYNKKMIKKIMYILFIILNITFLFAYNAQLKKANAQIMSTEVQQIGEITEDDVFTKLVDILTELFYSGRNLIFILSAFSLLLMAYNWVTAKEIDWQSIIWFVVALTVLATAGWFVDAVVYGTYRNYGVYVAGETGMQADTIFNGDNQAIPRIRLENIGLYEGVGWDIE